MRRGARSRQGARRRQGAPARPSMADMNLMYRQGEKQGGADAHGPAARARERRWSHRSRQRLGRLAEAMHVEVRVGAVALHRYDLQVAPEVPRVQPGQRQAVAVPGEHR